MRKQEILVLDEFLEETEHSASRDTAVRSLLALLLQQQTELQQVMSVFHEPLMLDLTSEQHGSVFGTFDPIYNAVCALTGQLQVRTGSSALDYQRTVLI